MTSSDSVCPIEVNGLPNMKEPDNAELLLFLRAWRNQLIADEAVGTPEDIEFDKRILDYYLALINDGRRFATIERDNRLIAA